MRKPIRTVLLDDEQLKRLHDGFGEVEMIGKIVGEAVTVAAKEASTKTSLLWESVRALAEINEAKGEAPEIDYINRCVNVYDESTDG